jgi:hypothetical protein
MANLEFNNTNNTRKLDRGNFIPTKIVEKLSTTSEAYNCFAEQRFCGNLQAFMVNYVLTISSYHSIYT